MASFSKKKVKPRLCLTGILFNIVFSFESRCGGVKMGEVTTLSLCYPPRPPSSHIVYHAVSLSHSIFFFPSSLPPFLKSLISSLPLAIKTLPNSRYVRGEKAVNGRSLGTERARRDDKNAQMIELHEMVLKIHDDVECDRRKCEDEHRESQENKLFLAIVSLYFLFLKNFIWQVYRKSLRNFEQRIFNNVNF